MIGLSDFERELLALCAEGGRLGETTTTLHEEMLSVEYDRDYVEATLRGLVDRGLMTRSRGTFAGAQRLRDGEVLHRVYDDDWWSVTDAGLSELGLSSGDEGIEQA